jgi:WD40 repeat protein
MVAMIDRQEVPSERDGKLMFIGTEIKKGENVPPEKIVEANFGYLLIEVGKDDPPGETPFAVDKSGKLYRYCQPNDLMTPDKLRVFTVKRRIRQLQVGDWVEKGQLLALVNPELQIQDLGIKYAKLESSMADLRASTKTKDEAENRYRTILDAISRNKNTFSQDDVRGSKLTWDRYIEEEKAKGSAVRVAEKELSAALTTLNMYEIRASISGQVKQIYKNTVGESIKNLENVLQIQNPNYLRVEGTVEVQVAKSLRKGMKVFIEATRPDEPLAVLHRHQHEVNAVAVSKGSNPLIVSGSEDRTLRIWARKGEQWNETWIVNHNAAVRTVACTPATAKGNFALSGAADGSVHLFNLDEDLEKTPPRELSRQHTGAVLGAAFNADGTLALTGGEDRSLCLWDVENGKLLHRQRDAHGAVITSVQSAGKNQFVSTGRDNRLIVWKVEDGNRLVHVSTIYGRDGDVAKLGVSPDGAYVLIDQGKELRRVSLETGQIEGAIRNANEAMTFSDMALFAPNGLVVLTNAASEKRIQLWRTPTATARPEEMRQFVWNNAPASCGAFAPDSSFAVTGTRDHRVLVWAMPEVKNGKLVEQSLEATISRVETSLDNSTQRLVPVWAELVNPGWVTPGGTATMVIPPQPLK